MKFGPGAILRLSIFGLLLGMGAAGCSTTAQQGKDADAAVAEEGSEDGAAKKKTKKKGGKKAKGAKKAKQEKPDA